MWTELKWEKMPLKFFHTPLNSPPSSPIYGFQLVSSAPLVTRVSTREYTNTIGFTGGYIKRLFIYFTIHKDIYKYIYIYIYIYIYRMRLFSLYSENNECSYSHWQLRHACTHNPTEWDNGNSYRAGRRVRTRDRLLANEIMPSDVAMRPQWK